MVNITDIFPLITGTGGALVVLAVGCWMFATQRIAPRNALTYRERQIAHRDKQIDDLRQALAAERLRGDTAVLAAQTTNSVLAALHKGVTSGNPPPDETTTAAPMPAA